MDVRIVDLKFPEMLGGGISAAHFKTLRAVVFRCTSHVVEHTRRKEERHTVGCYPGGVRALGESLGVEENSEAMVKNRGWETLLDEVVGTGAH